MSLSLELTLGSDAVSYNNMLSMLPSGDDNLQRGIVVPAHPVNLPLNFTITGVEVGHAYLVHVTSEWESAPVPDFAFVPTTNPYQFNLALGYGPNTLNIVGSNGDAAQFLLSATNYALLFRALASDITTNLRIPLTSIENNINSPIAYMLAMPLIGGLSRYIPANLEIISTLSYKLLVKNLLHCPGTNGSTLELLSSFCSSTPIFNPMHNLGVAETTLYRTEEQFGGYEAHVWLPNYEIERWRTFVTLLGNLPQLYTVSQVVEGEVYVKVGDKLKRHIFDFDSAAANSVLQGTESASECMMNLFSVDMAVAQDSYLSFCQAAYLLDSQIVAPGLLTPDADLLAISTWVGLSLTGRFEQQYDISPDIHHWVYDSTQGSHGERGRGTLAGSVDGSNRYFTPSLNPSATHAVKLFVDGLMLKVNKEFQVSLGSTFRSGAFLTYNSNNPILLDVDVGLKRTFIAPVFACVDVEGGANLQYLITVANQTFTNIEFVVSTPPDLNIADPEVASIHYITPGLTSYVGSQFGIESIPTGTILYQLTFPTPLVTNNYQLLVQYAEDPMPVGGAVNVSQPTWVVRNHTPFGADIEFSMPITSPNAQLHWWMISEDNVALERGTVPVDGMDKYALIFSGGPYLDPVIVQCQLWTTDPLSSANIPLVSFTFLSDSAVTFNFSDTLAAAPAGSTALWYLDYCIFPSQFGNLIEIFVPPSPGQLVEAHYDTLWPNWFSAGLLPVTDGAQKEFTLPFPMGSPESLYLTLNGRLLTQGAQNQYVVTSPTTVRLNFAPAQTQILWASYPMVAPSGPHAGKLPSSWNQGFLTRQGNDPGESATGSIRNAGKIAIGDTVKIGDTTLLAVATATGTIRNLSIIAAGNALTFSQLGIELLAVPQGSSSMSSAIAEITAITTVADVSGSLNSKYFQLSRPGLPGLYVWFNINNSGIDPLIPSKIGIQVALSTNSNAGTVAAAIQSALGLMPYFISLFGNTLTITNRVGGAVDAPIDGSSTASNSYETGFTFDIQRTGQDSEVIVNQFKVGLGQDADAESLVAVINNHPVLRLHYYAEYAGDGLTTVKALFLAAAVTEVSSVQATSDILGESLNGEYFWLGSGYYAWFSVHPKHLLGSVATFAALPVTATLGDSYLTLDTSIYYQWDGAEWLDIGSLGVDPSPVGGTGIEVSIAQNSSANTVATALATATDLAGFPSAVDGAVVTFAQPAAGTIAHHATDFNTGFGIKTLQYGQDALLIVDQTLTVSGTSLTTTNITGDSPPRIGVFAAGIKQATDSASLASAINAHPDLNFRYRAQASTGVVKLTSFGHSTQADAAITVGLSMTANDLVGGKQPNYHLPMLTPKAFYYDEAPVITLDGVSTRLYDQYSGNAVQFKYKPTYGQEAYAISQVFAIDHHPLDSMAANQDCNYPKGLFTQGTTTNLNFVDYAVSQVGSLVLILDGLPVQEEPEAIDTTYTKFHLKTVSAKGADSLMVWIDGIFQSPINAATPNPNGSYSYSESGSVGVLTFTSPISPNQSLWAWYLPSGSSAVDERVNLPIGVIDGVNTTFTIPDSPFTYRESLVLFLEGLYQLQNTDYSINLATNILTFTNAPSVLDDGFGLPSLVYHLNRGVAEPQNWNQIRLAVGGGEVLGTVINPASLVGPVLTNPLGSVPTVAALHWVTAAINDVYIAIESGRYYQWDGLNWNMIVQSVPSSPTGSVDDVDALDWISAAVGDIYLVTNIHNEGQPRYYYQWDGVDWLPLLPNVNDSYFVTSTNTYYRWIGSAWVSMPITYTIPHLIPSDLPTSVGSVLVAFNGLIQRNGIDFSVVTNITGYPTGEIIFAKPPEPTRIIDVAFIRRS